MYRYCGMAGAMRAVLVLKDSKVRTMADAADLLQSHFEMSRATAYRVAGMAAEALGRNWQRREPPPHRYTAEQRAAMAARMREVWRNPVYREARLRSITSSQRVRRAKEKARR